VPRAWPPGTDAPGLCLLAAVQVARIQAAPDRATPLHRLWVLTQLPRQQITLTLIIRGRPFLTLPDFGLAVVQHQNIDAHQEYLGGE